MGDGRKYVDRVKVYCLILLLSNAPKGQISRFKQLRCVWHQLLPAQHTGMFPVSHFNFAFLCLHSQCLSCPKRHGHSHLLVAPHTSSARHGSPAMPVGCSSVRYFAQGLSLCFNHARTPLRSCQSYPIHKRNEDVSGFSAAKKTDRGEEP